MSLNVYANVLTARQIVTLAERFANNPGFHLTPNGVEPVSSTDPTNPMVNAPAYATLQMILDHLATTQNFTFARTALDIWIISRNNDLPGNYWRVGFADPCWLSSQDGTTERTQFRILDAQEFHRRYQDGLIGTPLCGYINRDTGVLTVDPAPDRTYTLELHYYPWQPALLNPEDRPWLPYSKYLVNALLKDLYLHQDDTRWQIADKENRETMKQIKGAMGDDKDRASSRLELSPDVYPNPIEI